MVTALDLVHAFRQAEQSRFWQLKHKKDNELNPQNSQKYHSSEIEIHTLVY